MSFYLLGLENPNSKEGWYYATRKKDIQGIILHISESYGAGDLAKLYSKIPRPSSMHVVVDDKEYIELLPDSYTAFHTPGYNSSSIGVEIAYESDKWSTKTSTESKIIKNLAIYCNKVINKYDIPLRLCTKTEWDSGLKGFTLHNVLDPDYAYDPGNNFEIIQLFNEINILNTNQ